MNRLLCAISALALIVPAAAAAQQQQQNERHHHHSGDRQDRDRGHGKHDQNRSDHQSQQQQRQSRSSYGTQRPQRAQARPVRRMERQVRRDVRRNERNRYEHRYNGRTYQVRRVRERAYHYPRHHQYRRWSIGRILPRVFLSNSYYYNNWARLGVYPPPRGFRWVRYGPDLLLVNVYTGRIRDVVYGAFYY